MKQEFLDFIFSVTSTGFQETFVGRLSTNKNALPVQCIKSLQMLKYPIKVQIV